MDRIEDVEDGAGSGAVVVPAGRIAREVKEDGRYAGGRDHDEKEGHFNVCPHAGALITEPSLKVLVLGYSLFLADFHRSPNPIIVRRGNFGGVSSDVGTRFSSLFWVLVFTFFVFENNFLFRGLLPATGPVERVPSRRIGQFHARTGRKRGPLLSVPADGVQPDSGVLAEGRYLVPHDDGRVCQERIRFERFGSILIVRVHRLYL